MLVLALPVLLSGCLARTAVSVVTLPVNRITLSIDPASGVSMPERGQWIRVTGRFDHPLAEACAELAGDDEDPDHAVFGCRLQFVPASVEAAGS